MKTCKRCYESKTLDEFYPKRATCKVCYNEARPKVLCACGRQMRVGALQCRPCQIRSAGRAGNLVRTEQAAPHQALRRAKVQTRRWLRDESGKRCPTCVKRVRSKNGATYCSYPCFAATVNPKNTSRRTIKPGLRAKVVARDGYVCQICHEPTSLVHDPADDLSPEIDHVVEVRNGGRNTLANLRVAHRVCNRERNRVLWSS